MAKKNKIKDELIQKEEEVALLKDKYLRLVAKYAKENLITSILPVIDDFERANQNNEKDVKGYKLIGQKMIDILKKQNLNKIPIKKNEVFDLEKHEAISSMPVNSKNKKGKII